MSQPPQDALPPFSGALDPEGDTPPSDIIIRSSDGVDLHVHKAIVGFASVFFQNMFSIAGTGGDSNSGADIFRDGKPVIICDEPAAVLHQLLSIAYPRDGTLTDQGLDGVAEVYRVADKFIFTGVKKQLESMLVTPAVLEAHAHRVFAIAHLRELPVITRIAAIYTLKSPVCPANLAFPEMHLLTGADLQKLYDFHHACGRAAERIASTWTNSVDFDNPSAAITHSQDGSFQYVWWQGIQNPGYHNGDCGPSFYSGPDDMFNDLMPAPWFKNHTELLGKRIRAVPSRATVEAEALVLAAQDREMIECCHACSGQGAARRQLPFFARQLATSIEASNITLG
ncbi:hypothetical protein C8R46DRAFT_1218296 [Mycena filopes]|nr:hypothetical protein C8R46DRAFT_1218296 [Mycena filopes]